MFHGLASLRDVSEFLSIEDVDRACRALDAKEEAEFILNERLKNR